VLRMRTAFATAAGLLSGAFPLLLSELRSGESFRSLHVAVAQTKIGPLVPLSDRIQLGGQTGPPAALGFCGIDHCSGWAKGWAPVIVALLVIAAVIAGVGMRFPSPNDEPHALAKEALRLVLAAGGLASVVSYLMSRTSAVDPMSTARYLAFLAVSLPAMIWPLWRTFQRRNWGGWVAVVPVAALALTMLAGTVSVAAGLPQYAKVKAEQTHMLDELQRDGVRYVYAEYWTCNWITFRTNERVICGVVNDDLSFGRNRYPAYWHDQSPAVVAIAGSALDVEVSRLRPDIVPAASGPFHIYSSTVPFKATVTS